MSLAILIMPSVTGSIGTMALPPSWTRETVGPIISGYCDPLFNNRNPLIYNPLGHTPAPSSCFGCFLPLGQLVMSVRHAAEGPGDAGADSSAAHQHALGAGVKAVHHEIFGLLVLQRLAS